MDSTRALIIDKTLLISQKIDLLLDRIAKQEQEIMNLRKENEELVKNNRVTLDQIKEYIKELEQIRSHYVNSNNKHS